MVTDRFRPLKALRLSQIMAMARKAAAKRPADLEVMLHCWGEALRRHSDLTVMMELRSLFDQVKVIEPQRFKRRGVEPADWFLDAYETARLLSKGSAKRGIYRVYVLLLRGYPGGGEGAPALYVGESHLKAQARLAQHLDGINHSRAVQRFGVAALPSFTPQLTDLSRDDSKRLEAELADALRSTLSRFRLSPSRVQGGH
ncbi:MAG: hypothetical protein GC190_07535 [Alphaproteobacteria bacterium]|nr:hypothetical protein [Alphaproteobacteria bacterium]